MNKNTGKAIVTSANPKNKPWRETVSVALREAFPEFWEEEDGRKIPFIVSLIFYLPRPKSRKKDRYMTTRPDLDKLIRSCLDAGTGIVWSDDAYVRGIYSEKEYVTEDQEPGVKITIAWMKE